MAQFQVCVFDSGSMPLRKCIQVPPDRVKPFCTSLIFSHQFLTAVNVQFFFAKKVLHSPVSQQKRSASKQWPHRRHVGRIGRTEASDVAQASRNCTREPSVSQSVELVCTAQKAEPNPTAQPTTGNL